MASIRLASSRPRRARPCSTFRASAATATSDTALTAGGSHPPIDGPLLQTTGATADDVRRYPADDAGEQPGHADRCLVAKQNPIDLSVMKAERKRHQREGDRDPASAARGKGYLAVPGF